METRDTLYLDPNQMNTDATIEAAKKRAVELEWSTTSSLHQAAALRV